MLRREHDLAPLDEVIKTLSSGEPLPPKCRDHALRGEYQGSHECHVTPDWLLIYDIDVDAEGTKCLYLTRTGTHSDLFK